MDTESTYAPSGMGTRRAALSPLSARMSLADGEGDIGTDTAAADTAVGLMYGVLTLGVEALELSADRDMRVSECAFVCERSKAIGSGKPYPAEDWGGVGRAPSESPVAVLEVVMSVLDESVRPVARVE